MSRRTGRLSSLTRRASIGLLAMLAVLGTSLTGGSAAQEPPDLGAPLAGTASLVPAGKYPAVAFIDVEFTDHVASCTGTLIAPTWVLTAAHCLDGPSISEINILLGSVDIYGDLGQDPLPPGVELHQAKGWIMHGGFFTDLETAHHDVALIKLPTASAIEPIPVATDVTLVEPEPGQTLPATVVGFGVNADRDNDKRLREGPTSIATDADAAALVDELLTPIERAYNIFMTPDPATQPVLCSGDSGGPVLVEQDGQPRVAGVNSFGLAAIPCQGPDPLDAAADVVGSDLADWVAQVIDDPQETCAGRIPDVEGTTYPDVIGGSRDADVLHGRGGGDIIDGREGPDVICGGKSGDDLDGGPGRDDIRGNTGHDTINGGTGGDSISGGKGRDAINGSDGRDTIRGHSGADTIEGGGDDDTIHGGSGDDTIRGKAGDDTINGSGGDDILYGGSGDDTIRGKAGADTIDGKTGIDTCYGGPDKDTLHNCELPIA